MAQFKKFGTFGGVFTPSILTILGVIMYLRFPSIIGQSGLINTLGIIVIAHIISFTTSLSVASLSTDKPVQNGGTYFMISRSLGLSIGGTLGLALFVGLSFSVSLYLIGFAESFLQYWDLNSSINTIRIAGTIVLLIVTTITFISTSLAIKSQYFIMVAIVLSLASIFSGTHEFSPKVINMTPLPGAAPFMLLFGIFFPAVTGFEAGVSMSGDLKNAKKSLPLGAILAVSVGFVVYISLALFFALTVDANALANDPQILFKISLVPALVIAGIWGATLSSALGSILGAPRILQAIAMDKIAPKIFAKGTGKSNEPRNALILAFFIAEAGILIGELDVIARIVSMFFITTYAFLNLASAIESWSSSDFRPAFKIPRFVSILGTLSAFIVMILLDFIALTGATIVLGMLYFFLQRKELILESGDAWNSFWTNLAKRALLKLSMQKTNKRNWRPNIILFSGGAQARPHLVEMGLSLTGKLGALTDFNLVNNSDPGQSDLLSVSSKINKDVNYFKRQFLCNNLEDGIQTVTNVYGFSGFEPNTILMGWSRNSNNFDFIANLLTDFKKKQLNAVFLDYDKESGFGQKERIDIWWNGKGRHLSFALNIVKFLQSDPAWMDAEIRILVISNNSSLIGKIYRNIAEILDEKRMKAEIKIINDDFGTRSKDAIISSESMNADLAVLGLPQKTNPYTRYDVLSINPILKLPVSKLILSPSEEFEEINLVGLSIKNEKTEQLIPQFNEMPSIPMIESKILKDRLDILDADCLEITASFIEKGIKEAVSNQEMLIRNVKGSIGQCFMNLEKEITGSKKDESAKILRKYHQLYLLNINAIIKNKNEEIIREIKACLSDAINHFSARVENYINGLSDTLLVPYILTSENKDKNYKVHFQKLVSYHLNLNLMPEVKNWLRTFEDVTIKMFTDIKKIIFRVNDIFEKLKLNPDIDIISIQRQSLEINQEFEGFEQFLKNFTAQSVSLLLSASRGVIIHIAEDLLTPKSLSRAKIKIRKKLKNSVEYFTVYPEEWEVGIRLINNTLNLDALVLSDREIIKNIIQKGNDRVQALLIEKVIKPIDLLLENIEKVTNLSDLDISPLRFPDQIEIKSVFHESYLKIAEIIGTLPEEMLLPEAIVIDADAIQLSDYKMVSLNLHRVGRYYFDTLFYEPFYREIEQLESIANRAIIECKEANSMLKFRLNNIHNNNEIADIDQSSPAVFFKKILLQINSEKEKLLVKLQEIEYNSDNFLSNAFSKLFYHTIIDSEDTISVQQRELTGKRLVVSFSRKINYIKTKLSNFVILVLNNASSGIIFSRKYIEARKVKRTQISQLWDVVRKLIPDSKIYNQIPVFYWAI